MDLKDKVSVWAGILTLAVFLVMDRINIELEISGDPVAAIVGVIGFAFGFVIVYFIVRWILERYFKGRSSQPSGQQVFF